MKPPPRDKLSGFPALMRDWTELAPYNFIHALRLRPSPGPSRLTAATRAALAALGFASSHLRLERPRTDLETHLTAELNRAFAPGELPLRFFLIGTALGDDWFGVTLDHWIADDFSSRQLLQRILSADHSPAQPALAWAAGQPPSRNWLAEWRGFLQQARALRRAGRVPLTNCFDFTVETFRHELPPGALENIRALARAQRATVHDVFLAAGAQACGAAHPWPHGARRDAIALASAMDLRRFASGPAREACGLLITQYTVVESHPENRSLPEVVARVAEQTRALKQLSGRLSFTAGRLFWKMARTRHARATLYHRGAPYAAGLSNVNLSGSWLELPGVADFRRVGPAGPIVPLVLMITTRHGRVSIDTTYRASAFTRAAAEALLADFAQRLLAPSLAA